MQSMIITPKPSDPEVIILSYELKRRGYGVDILIPGQVKYQIFNNEIKQRLDRLQPKSALLRGFGAENTQSIFFRLDILRAIEEYGVKLVNSRDALEIASDKFLTSIFFEKYNIPTPKTIICEKSSDAISAFEELGNDVILKPIFGSKGIGITRLNSRDFAELVIYSLEKLNLVYYLQEFTPHYNRDIRVLVLGQEAVAGMYRISDDWKTNIHAGAIAKPLELTDEIKRLAVKASNAVKTDIAGVDIIESDQGFKVLEVNSIPGFTALQKVTDINLSEKIITYFLNISQNDN